MLPVKTMTPLKASKQTSAAASKIKNKILSECLISMLFVVQQHYIYTASFEGLRYLLKEKKMFRCSPNKNSCLCDHTRHLLLLQSIFEDQQQGLSSCFGGSEGEEQAAGERDCVPAETSGGSVL